MKTTKKYGKKTDLALNLWVKLSRAFAVINKKATEDIAKYGLTEPQFCVLECLGHLGQLSIGELTRKQLVSAGNMTVVVNNLEKEGLVERSREPGNRRVVKVQLTAKGSKKFDEIFLNHAKYITHLISVLTEKEQSDLAKLLKKLGLIVQQLNHNTK
ncbi:MAG: MarR family transcriptional regulator [Bacteroidota bacterium]|nr:MarR family transcriptional regulator [Bacteroidota bacterium]